MSPDAKLRMEIYQEGQRAFGAGTECPYRDWRANTWGKGWLAAQEWSRTVALAFSQADVETIEAAERRIAAEKADTVLREAVVAVIYTCGARDIDREDAEKAADEILRILKEHGR